MAIDNFGKYQVDPEFQKQWDNLRNSAFMAAASEKVGEKRAQKVLAEHNGMINSAVDALGIDAEFKKAFDVPKSELVSQIPVEPN